jgi:hypothetical protein
LDFFGFLGAGPRGVTEEGGTISVFGGNFGEVLPCKCMR